MFLLFSFFYLGLILIALGLVLSQFNEVYQALGANLPWYTQILLNISEWFKYFYSIYFIIAYYVFFIAFYIFLYFTNRGKIFRDRFYHKFKISPQSVDKIGKLIFFILLISINIKDIIYY